MENFPYIFMRRVDPSVYTKEYYLGDCTGYNEFKKSYGEEFEPRFAELVKHFGISSGINVLDIGCGRGEMVYYAAKHGATAVGIDYAKDAIALAKVLKSKKPKTIQKKMQFFVMDAKKLQFPDSSFDLIILTDVVEHLYPEELEEMFKEIKRVLKNKGILVVHTAPNKLFNDFAYPWYCYPISTLFVGLWNVLTGNKYPNIAKPSSLRTDSHLIMHINEPTFFSLRKLFSTCAFNGKIISTNITARKPFVSAKDVLFNFIVFLDPFSRRFPLNILFGSDFVSVLVNKK